MDKYREEDKYVLSWAGILQVRWRTKLFNEEPDIKVLYYKMHNILRLNYGPPYFEVSTYRSDKFGVNYSTNINRWDK